MRHATACRQCRTRKRKCDIGIGANGICKPCATRRLPCTLASRVSGGIHVAPQDHYEHPHGIDLIPELGPEQTEAQVANYFYYIHDRPHSLFHKPSFWHEVHDGSIDRALLYSICSLGARFSADDDVQQQWTALASTSRRLLHAQLEDVCLARVQTCIILGNICAAELDPRAEALYFGLANRMAHILNLHKRDVNDDFVTRELKARVWWTLIMADHWVSAGLRLPRLLDGSIGDVMLPGEEDAFQRERAGEAHIPHPHDLPKLGLWAQMIALVAIFGPVQDLNYRLADDTLAVSSSHSHVRMLASRLDEWYAGLPADLHMNDANLKTLIARSLGGPFAALHLGYHHYSTLLFFQYLDTQRVGAEHISDHSNYADRCRHHASAYSDMLLQTRTVPGCEAMYITVGHMAVVSSCVLLHTFLFGSQHQLEEARAKLTANFEALIELKRLWPSLEKTIGRLHAFQRSCLERMDDNTHRMDGWMLRLLLEHSVPLDERRPDGYVSVTSSPQAFAEPGSSHERHQREKATSAALASLWG